MAEHSLFLTLYNLLANDYTELWKNIGSFINENIQQDVSITFKGIVLGHYESDSTKSNSWCIIYLKKIICKFYIHKCKFTNNKPHFIIFLKEFKNDLNTISMLGNKKAIKTISFCNDFNLYTVIDI